MGEGAHTRNRKMTTLDELLPTTITSRGCRFQVSNNLYPKDINKNNIYTSRHHAMACETIGWIPINSVSCTFPVAPNWTPIIAPTKERALSQLCELRNIRKVYQPITRVKDDDLELALTLSMQGSKKSPQKRPYDTTEIDIDKGLNIKFGDEKDTEESETEQAIQLSLMEEKRYEYDFKMKTMVENGTDWSRESWKTEVFEFYDERASQLANIYGEAKRHWDATVSEQINRGKKKLD